MNNKETLLHNLAEAQEALKEYNKFIHLFSDDDGIKTLAKLNRTLGSIKSALTMSEIKDIAFPESKPLQQRNKPTLVKVKPCADKYENKTYIGFFLLAKWLSVAPLK